MNILEMHGTRRHLEVLALTSRGPADHQSLLEVLTLLREAWDRLPAWVKERDEHFRQMVERLAAALAQAGSGAQAFHGRLQESTTRIKALTSLEDLREIKYRILSETEELHELCERRRKEEAAVGASVVEHIQSLQKQLNEAEQRAAIDPLTRAANRGAFDVTLERWTKKKRAHGDAFVLAIFDVDDFKQINDSHGHPVGDRVLIALVKALRGVARATDVVARIGGEEFAVLMEGVALAQAEEKFSAALREMAAARYCYESEGVQHSVRFTASCGVAEFLADERAEDFLARADAALYQAKHRGKNRVVVKSNSAFSRLLHKVTGR